MVKRLALAAFCLGALALACARLTPPAHPSPVSNPTLTPAKPEPSPTSASPIASPNPAQGQADILFINGVILTMDETRPRAQALAIRGERILAIGDDETILALRRDNTQVINLQGATLMPGFVDAHTHLFNDAAMMGLTLEQAQQQLLQVGITSLGDAYISPDFLPEIAAFAAQGKLQVRTSVYLTYSTNCGEVVGEWYKDHPPTRMPGEMLRINGVKVFADGGTCGKPALSYTPEGKPGESGDLWFSPEELATIVREAQASGHQVLIHALGDRAVEAAQDGIAAALAGQPNLWRHRIDHNAVLRPDLLPRYGEIGIIPVLFGSYPLCSPFGPPPGPPYIQWEHPWRELLDANPGLPIAWHGDDPYLEPLAPLLDVYSYVTRRSVSNAGQVCDPPGWLADDAITAVEALKLMTTGSAYALFRDEEAGSLKAGLYADLVTLTADPTEVDAEAIRDIQVKMTMVGGQVRYCAAGWEALCPSPLANPASWQLLASSEADAHPAGAAIDGNTATWWAPVEQQPQWLQIDLGVPTRLAGLSLTVFQPEPGLSVYRVWGSGPDGAERLLIGFSRRTTDGETLSYRPPAPWEGIRYLRIETEQAPPGSGWREIALLSQ